MSKTILVIDDDSRLNDLLTEYLGKNNFKVTTVENPKDGLVKLKTSHFDLVILDIMLPDMDGFETCKQIRKDHDVPIVMLTARGEVTDKVVGLELGADDYLPKPFEPRELLARIQSVLRRTEVKFKKNEVLKFSSPAGILSIDPNKRAAILDDKDLELTSTEFELLMLFVKHNGKVLSRDEIMQNTRGISWMSFDRSVDVMVSRLRNKLKSGSSAKELIIKTGAGAAAMRGQSGSTRAMWSPCGSAGRTARHCPAPPAPRSPCRSFPACSTCCRKRRAWSHRHGIGMAHLPAWRRMRCICCSRRRAQYCRRTGPSPFA